MTKTYALTLIALLVVPGYVGAQTADYGDAPDGGTFNGIPLNFPSLAASGGPRHNFAASSTFWIAANPTLLVPDTEADSRQVNQDIDNGQPFIFVNLLSIPAPAKVTVPVTTSASHDSTQTLYLNVAIDVDDDFDFDDDPNLNWVVRNFAFKMSPSKTLGITSDWFGFGSNLQLFPVWGRATVTSAPVSPDWNTGTPGNVYTGGETEDWFYTFGQDGPYPDEWKNPPRDLGDPKKEKKRKPKKPEPEKCVKLKYPRVVYVRCFPPGPPTCFTVEVRNCDGVDITDLTVSFEFEEGTMLPAGVPSAGPADIDANKKAKFVICVQGWPCTSPEEQRWARYKIKLAYDPAGLDVIEEAEIIFGSMEFPLLDSTGNQYLGCIPRVDTTDSPIWDAKENESMNFYLYALTGRYDPLTRWIVGNPVLQAKKLPTWAQLVPAAGGGVDSTLWLVFGIPPIDGLGIDTVILTVTSDNIPDSFFTPRDFFFPVHVQMKNSPPSLDQTFDTLLTVNAGSTLTQTIEASDPDKTRGRRDTLWIDYFFVDPSADTVVEPPTAPVFTDNGDGTASFAWTPTSADAGNYKLVVVVWDYSFTVDSSVTDITVVSGIDDLPGAGIAMSQNMPNPFSYESVITVELPGGSDILLDVINVDGRVVQIIAGGFYPAGSHQINWNSSDLPSGTYMYRLRAGSAMLMNKAVIIR